MNVEVKFFTAEHYVQKSKYATLVYKFLEAAYKDCGGINLASGFANAQDMLLNISVWRLTFMKEKLISAMMFKTKDNQLKMVAYAPLSDIDPKIRRVDLIYMLNNSYVELSGKLLSITLKEIKTTWKKYVSEHPQFYLKKKKLIRLKKYLENSKLPTKSVIMYQKLKEEYPELIKYCYLRSIGNELKLKLLMVPNNMQI